MIGHGRPTWSARRSTARCYGAGVLLRAVVLLIALAAPAHAEEVTLKLRMTWGGGQPRAWRGTIELSSGSLAELTTLGVEADSPGSIWLAGTDTVRIEQPSPRTYDGIDILIAGDTEAALSIQLTAADGKTPQPVEIPLKDLIDGAHNSTLDDSGNRLAVGRSPGDRLRVEFDRPHLVFSPGETFEFRIEGNLSGDEPEQRLQTQLLSVPSGQRVASVEHAATGARAAIKVPLPAQEGVYDLVISVLPSSRLKQRLRLTQPVVERKIQLVVVAPQAPPSSGEPPTTKVVEINPVNSRWWERLASLPAIPGFRKGPLGNGDAATWEHPTLGPMIQLGPGGTAADMSWEAYPLPIHHPGQVHVLEVEYPNDVPQAMGISLLEPNAAGEVVPIGLDSGVYVSDEDATLAPRMARHRVVFWPKTKTPVVLITNRRPGARAVYGKITVLSGPQNQLPVLALAKGESSTMLPPAFQQPTSGGRLWAGYMDRPLLAENFGAPEAFDPPSRRSLDDWNTFYQGGSRLVQYLEHAGFSGLMLAVLADGSTIYPSRLLQPTPRYDTGIYFATGQDPRRKDALELLFRLFDREDLVLVPALHFTAPLPELEALKRTGGAEAEGLEWIGADGRPMSASAKSPGVSPRYNLLDPRVQQAMFNVAHELIRRYAAHESFGGLALAISPESYAQLPGDEWGLDDQTIARFESQTGTQVPGTGGERFAARAKFLAGPGREAWQRWRSNVVAAFHRQLEQELAAARPGAKLYLAGTTLLEDRQLQLRNRPSVQRRVRLDATLAQKGLNLTDYTGQSGIAVLRPQLVRPATGAMAAADSELYQSRELDQLFTSAGQRAALFYHDPQKARVAGFDAQSPFGAANTYTWLVSQMSPSGDRNRRRFVHSLAVGDTAQMFDGGWMLPLGQEESLRSLISVYRQLPKAPFATVPGEFQPVTIRTLHQAGHTYFYLVNDSPWPASVTVELDTDARSRLERLGSSPGGAALEDSAGTAVWKVDLPPYDLAAARIASPQPIEVLAAHVQLPPGVRETLERRVQDLVARVRALGNPLLENAGFDLPLAAGQIPGWTAQVPADGRVLVDSRTKHAGTRSVMLASQGSPVSLISAPFTPPPAGRLTVEVWLRTATADAQPSLRISVEGETSSGRVNPQGVIERVGAAAAKPGDWVHYNFPVENLPTTGLGAVRVKFELMTAGEVWLDDANVRVFSGPELLELSKINSLASLHLERGQYADCTRLLEGYWPQFLVANIPLASVSTPVAQRPKPAAPEPERPAEAPSLFETMRSYLPPMFR
jgi:hypothetical protein